MRYLIVLILLVAGCAPTPDDIVVSGVVVDFEFHHGGVSVYDVYVVEFKDGRKIKLRIADNNSPTFHKNRMTKIAVDQYGVCTWIQTE